MIRQDHRTTHAAQGISFAEALEKFVNEDDGDGEDSDFAPPDDDAMSLESESISESDGEDALHVFLPPIDPACFFELKTTELEQAQTHS